jgi:hypothetical protein
MELTLQGESSIFSFEFFVQVFYFVMFFYFFIFGFFYSLLQIVGAVH